MMKNIVSVVFLITLCLSLNAQPIFVDISTIPKSGTVLIYSHQDDDLIWMYPFWNITEKFIIGAMPSTPDFKSIIHQQQMYLDANSFNINYESNWENPWGTITDMEYTEYYWDRNSAYSYLGNEYLLCDDLSESDNNLESIRIKAKLEQFIASPTVSRIITHNNWGESGNQNHTALNKAVRDLAVKYRKDVWMMFCNTANYEFIDLEVPGTLTYTLGTYNATLYSAIREIYNRPFGRWTYGQDYTPDDEHPYVKIVDRGVDLTNYIPVEYFPEELREVSGPNEIVQKSGPFQLRTGAYILDGVDDYVTLSSNQNTSFTIAMRLRPGQIRAMDISRMTEYPSSDSYDRTLYMNTDGTITAELNDASVRTVTSNSILTADNWTHVTLTSDGATLKLFINGELDNSSDANFPVTIFNTPEFVIGQAKKTANFFEGQISEVLLFDYAMSDAEITAIADDNPPPSFTINSSTGVGGAITPSGTRNVLQGTNITYYIQPESYYTIENVVIDGVNQGAINSYNFNNVTDNHTISATFSTRVGNIAFEKLTACSTFEQDDYNSSKANDEDGSNNSYWSGAVNNPEWWEVDLGAIYDISYIVIRNLVFASTSNGRVYHYNIQASTSSPNDFNYTQIIEKSNDNISIDAGDRYNVNISARYLRVNIIYSTPNNTAHITDFRVYGTPAKTWTGSAGTEWNTPGNWDPNGVPGPTDNVFIPDGAPFPVFTGDLTINTETSLTINPGGALTVTGNLINNGTLNLESDDNGIASLIIGSYTRGSEGTENIELFLTGGGNETNYPWHYISSPVSLLTTNVFTTGTNPSNNLATYVESHSSPDVNLRWIAWDGWDYSILPNGGYPETPVTFNNLEVGNGYNYYNFYTVKRTFGGTLNSGEVKKNLSYTGAEINMETQGWNLLGNPYTASIDWDEISRKGGIDNAIYFTRDNGFCSYVDGIGVPGSTTGIIPPMQGFFVKANRTEARVTFIPDDIRLHSNVIRYKKRRAIPLIRLKIENQKASDETVIHFKENATAAFDSELDAYKFSKTGSAVSLWTTIGSVSYSINGIPFPETEAEIPLDINTDKSGSYKLRATELQGLDNYNIYLIDKILGTTTNLKSNPTMSFSTSEGMLVDRFLIKIVYNPKEIENSATQESIFNVYYSNDFVNIQTLSDKWNGKSGSVDLIEISGKTIRKIDDIEFWENSLIQIPATGYKGLILVKIQSGLMVHVRKVMVW